MVVFPAYSSVLVYALPNDTFDICLIVRSISFSRPFTTSVTHLFPTLSLGNCPVGSVRTVVPCRMHMPISSALLCSFVDRISYASRILLTLSWTSSTVAFLRRPWCSHCLRMYPPRVIAMSITSLSPFRLPAPFKVSFTPASSHDSSPTLYFLRCGFCPLTSGSLVILFAIFSTSRLIVFTFSSCSCSSGFVHLFQSLSAISHVILHGSGLLCSLADCAT